VVPDWTGEEAYQRLTTLERSTDGFYIAEADLALRGPGDFLGTRQAGLPPFRVASLVRDTALLRAARDEALAWLARDPDLSAPESETVRAVLRHRWKGRLGLAQVGQLRRRARQGTTPCRVFQAATALSHTARSVVTVKHGGRGAGYGAGPSATITWLEQP